MKFLQHLTLRGGKISCPSSILSFIRLNEINLGTKSESCNGLPGHFANNGNTECVNVAGRASLYVSQWLVPLECTAWSSFDVCHLRQETKLLTSWVAVGNPACGKVVGI